MFKITIKLIFVFFITNIFNQSFSEETKFEKRLQKDINKLSKISGFVDNESQLYDEEMTHNPHHHALIHSDWESVISWVHFLDVPEQKCFRFTDTKGNILIPNEQNSGDIICFPSWVWHEVIPNQTSVRRIVISGNITFTHYDD